MSIVRRIFSTVSAGSRTAGRTSGRTAGRGGRAGRRGKPTSHGRRGAAASTGTSAIRSLLRRR